RGGGARPRAAGGAAGGARAAHGTWVPEGRQGLATGGGRAVARRTVSRRLPRLGAGRGRHAGRRGGRAAPRPADGRGGGGSGRAGRVGRGATPDEEAVGRVRTPGGPSRGARRRREVARPAGATGRRQPGAGAGAWHACAGASAGAGAVRRGLGGRPG